MSFDEYLATDTRYQRACTRRIKAMEAITNHGHRWGESRRFAGRCAGLRIDRLDRARESCGNAIEAARKRYDKLHPPPP